MKAFNLTIVTPEKVTFEGKVDYLNLPAQEGSWGVLAGHASSLVLLREGALVFDKDNAQEFLSVSGGFAEIEPNKTVVFAETAEFAQELDLERARLSAERAKEILQSAKKKKGSYEEADIEQAAASLRRALTRLKIFENYQKRRSYSPKLTPNPAGPEV